MVREQLAAIVGGAPASPVVPEVQMRMGLPHRARIPSEHPLLPRAMSTGRAGGGALVHRSLTVVALVEGSF